MSNWWGNADGTKEHAFSSFVPIPDGETAHAEILSVNILEATEIREECFEVRWKLIEGDYKKREISQKIRVNHADPIQKEKAKNQLLFLMKMFHVKPGENAPTTYDLAPMIGKVAIVVIGMYKNKEGKEFNYIQEVHPAGNAASQALPVDSAMSRNPRVTESIAEDDLPF